jgi:signal transduction histidine kinase
MTRIPIRVRVAAAFAVAMAAVLAGTALFLYLRLGSHLSLALDRELRLRTDDLSALVRAEGRVLPSGRGEHLVEPGEAYAQLLDRRGEVLDATTPLRRRSLLDEAELRLAEGAPIFANRSSVPGLDEPSRLLASPVVSGGRRLVLVVGVTRQDRAETLASLRDELLLAGPIALLLATAAGYALAGLALRPVEAMRRRAAAVSADNLAERLPVPPTRDELERLGHTLNDMLSRLDQALERERDFVADAGHELRTPLALLRTELELALRHGESIDELRGAVRRASEEVDRLAHLAEDLLLIARSERGRLRLQLEPLEVSSLLESVATRFSWRAEDAGRRLSVGPSRGMALEGDRHRLEQALGNLVDNGFRHGQGIVRLTAALVDGAVILRVSDQGVGFPDDFIPRAFDRFARPDKARGVPGSGLGLSIVKTIAEAHGGRVEAANSPGGGGEVSMTLPAGGRARESR